MQRGLNYASQCGLDVFTGSPWRLGAYLTSFWYRHPRIQTISQYGSRQCHTAHHAADRIFRKWTDYSCCQGVVQEDFFALFTYNSYIYLIRTLLPWGVELGVYYIYNYNTFKFSVLKLAFLLFSASHHTWRSDSMYIPVCKIVEGVNVCTLFTKKAMYPKSTTFFE